MSINPFCVPVLAIRARKKRSKPKPRYKNEDQKRWVESFCHSQHISPRFCCQNRVDCVYILVFYAALCILMWSYCVYVRLCLSRYRFIDHLWRLQLLVGRTSQMPCAIHQSSVHTTSVTLFKTCSSKIVCPHELWISILYLSILKVEWDYSIWLYYYLISSRTWTNWLFDKCVLTVFSWLL